MPEYLAPGVFVEEVSFRSKSIEGVSTTTTGFVGPSRYGPVIEPADVITSIGEFERSYAGGGKLQFATEATPDVTTESDNFLWQAVRAFFSEGGKRLYVARVFRPLRGDQYEVPNDITQVLPLAGPSETLYPDGHARFQNGGLTIRSRFPGRASNLLVDFTIKAGENILGSVLIPETERTGSPPIEYRPKIGALADRDVVLLLRANDEHPTTDNLYVAERDPDTGAWSFRNQSGLKSLDDLKLVIHPDHPHDRIFPLTISLRVFSDDRDHNLGNWVDLPLDPNHTRDGANDSLFGKFTRNPGSISEARSLPLVVSFTPADATGRDVLLAIAPSVLTPRPADESKRITVLERLVRGFTWTEALEGGNDGLRPGAGDYEGQADDEETFKTGLKQFEDVEDISIVAAPGSTADYEHYRDNANTIYGLLIGHAERMRYRIAVLDSPPDMGIADVRRVRAKLDSKHAALYYPWVKVLDPITRRELDLPPSGFVSGIFARNDINRAVYKAPANEVVTLALGFEQPINKAQQEVLNPEGINCFRFFEGRGYRLWGARTISSDPEWKYVNLRRYFAYLERSIDKGTQWAVFEPNGEALWANIRRTVEDFLLNEFQSGALLGDKPEKAYFVKCDRSTMTQNDLDNGRLICLVGVAALKPAEFVVFRIGQWTADRRG
jgi:phage tail sheath protein FI